MPRSYCLWLAERFSAGSGKKAASNASPPCSGRLIFADQGYNGNSGFSLLPITTTTSDYHRSMSGEPLPDAPSQDCPLVSHHVSPGMSLGFIALSIDLPPVRSFSLNSSRVDQDDAHHNLLDVHIIRRPPHSELESEHAKDPLEAADSDTAASSGL